MNVCFVVVCRPSAFMANRWKAAFHSGDEPTAANEAINKSPEYLECCGKRSFGGYSRLMSDYSKFGQIAPLSKFGVAFLALSLLCACSAMDSEISIATCSKTSHWIYNKIEFSEMDSFTEITVSRDKYLVFGQIIRNDKAFAEALKKQIAEDNKMSFNPKYIFLRSSPDISCARFVHAANVVDAHYPCKNGNVCIWAYGLGDGAMPLGIDPPPGATETELRRQPRADCH